MVNLVFWNSKHFLLTWSIHLFFQMTCVLLVRSRYYTKTAASLTSKSLAVIDSGWLEHALLAGKLYTTTLTRKAMYMLSLIPSGKGWKRAWYPLTAHALKSGNSLMFHLLSNPMMRSWAMPKETWGYCSWVMIGSLCTEEWAIPLWEAEAIPLFCWEQFYCHPWRLAKQNLAMAASCVALMMAFQRLGNYFVVGLAFVWIIMLTLCAFCVYKICDQWMPRLLSFRISCQSLLCCTAMGKGGPSTVIQD